MPGRYYIACETAFTENEKRLASEKARDDITRILTADGHGPVFECLPIKFDTGRWQDRPALVQIGEHKKAKEEWAEKTRHLTGGDVLLVQFPAVNHSLFLYQVLRDLKKQGVYLIAILHDVEAIRGSRRKNKSLKNRLRKHYEEVLCLQYFDRLIVHNSRMKELVAGLLEIPAERLIDLQIFDYLTSDTPDRTGRDSTEFLARRRTDGVAIAGNLTPVKAGYVYQLPENVRWNLFGVNFAGRAIPAECIADTPPEQGIIYYGSFPAEEIAKNLTGGFGLVWDGPSVLSCEGVYGEYLRINDPHKTSLYLAAGLPVIIWKEAALAPFILERGCGLAVGSLTEIRDLTSGMDEDTYRRLCRNAESVGRRLRSGTYTSEAVKNALAGMHD